MISPSPSQPFVISRTFDAPRALVWKAWTERDHLLRWFSPKGMTTSSTKIELRPGGVHHYCILMPDGKEIWGKWVFREIKTLERLVWVQCFSDAQGGVSRHPMAPGWPSEMLAVATFSEAAGKTTVTLEMIALNAPPAEQKLFDDSHGSLRGGWGGTFEQLEAYLPEIQKGGA